MLDFIIGRDYLIGIEDRVDFRAEFSEGLGVLEEQVHGVVHGNGGRVGTGIHYLVGLASVLTLEEGEKGLGRTHDGDLGHNFTPVETVGGTVFVFH